MSDHIGKPTAKKASGTEWYYPAVTTAFGSKVLPHGERQETRGKAIAEAKRLLATLTPAPTDIATGEIGGRE